MHEKNAGTGDVPWRPELPAGEGGKAAGIVAALVAALRSGRLRPGDRLPPQRRLAQELGVDLTTVMRGFRLARARGLVAGRAGQGSFVAEGALAALGTAIPAQVALVDLSMNSPPQPAAARLATRIGQGIAALLADGPGLARLHYGESGGSPDDRGLAAQFLAQRLGPLPPERVVLASGSQSALHALCGLLLRPGDRLLCGQFTYPGLIAVATSHGVRLTPVAMDAEGILPEALAQACRAARPKALYLIPSADNPTAATLPLERRARLAELAAEHGIAVIEDDAYGLLQATDLPPIARLAPERTWHVATLSKCATPGLRTALVAAPSAAEADRLVQMLRASCLMPPPLMTGLAMRWAQDGSLLAIRDAIRAENRARQQLAANILAGFGPAADPSCPHLWLQLPAGWRASTFTGEAGRLGLSVTPGDAFAVGPSAIEAVRVSLGVQDDRTALVDALSCLRRLLERQPAAAGRPVI
ncbi:MAG TPA: PLP-dependent aminotransferase family protein [Geminicoccus sp.]|uniref:aminotransferase-like domain-containing protein n=1 Tax=Geminicoccus sp. TaxID=2024832 RepID=UPI002B5F0B8D|nr:PLP-dependent aminotransferase family protein [Geminicoccus sp.]HWL68301.1 PLP-dependent aminotransferase family protein [Geminicoccus sp.]